jgi:hypothetical protein
MLHLQLVHLIFILGVADLYATIFITSEKLQFGHLPILLTNFFKTSSEISIVLDNSNFSTNKGKSVSQLYSQKELNNMHNKYKKFKLILYQNLLK